VAQLPKRAFKIGIGISDLGQVFTFYNTYVLIAESFHAAMEKAGLANGYGQVARHIKVEVGQQIGGRDGCS